MFHVNGRFLYVRVNVNTIGPENRPRDVLNGKDRQLNCFQRSSKQEHISLPHLLVYKTTLYYKTTHAYKTSPFTGSRRQGLPSI